MKNLFTVSPNESYVEIEVSRIRAGLFQPRVIFNQDSLEELAISIREEGLAQPILVRRILEEDGIEFEIIAGERRWRAFRLCGFKTIPAFVRVADDKKAALLSLIENVQRESLSAIEEARAYRKMVDLLGMTQQEIADKIGKSRPSIANTLRLLNLDREVLYLVETNEIGAASARCLLALPKHRQADAARFVIRRSLSCKQCEAYVESLLSISADVETDADPTIDSEEDAIIKDVEEAVQKLAAQLPKGITSRVRTNKDGSKKVSFHIPRDQWHPFVSGFRVSDIAESVGVHA